MSPRQDIVGQEFDCLTAVKHIPGKGWECLCRCGSIVYRKGADLRAEIKRGGRVGCGSCLTKANLVGQQFGFLTVISIHRQTPSGTEWECKCDCGGVAIRRTGWLKCTPHSGCDSCRSVRYALPHVTHGGSKTRLHKIWKGMAKRCRPSGSVHYGRRGIRVCEEWTVFAIFRDWALSHGYNDDLTIDRINVDGNYEPSNCEWVTLSENSRRMNAGYERVKKDKFGLHWYVPIEALFGSA